MRIGRESFSGSLTARCLKDERFPLRTSRGWRSSSCGRTIPGAVRRACVFSKSCCANTIRESARHSIPYGGGRLSAYRFTPDSPRGQLVIFGGFDSYIEEWFPILFALQVEGLDVVSFDGPGQGAALEAGVPMTSEWHKPVGAVLDHFGLTDVSLLGFRLADVLPFARRHANLAFAE